jgi:hypothetical protein
MIVRQGCTRIVFVFSKFVIKIPNFIYEHQHFLQGCYANWSERICTKTFFKDKDGEFYNKIAPTKFCLFFGLLSVQVRAIELNRHLTEEEIEYFKDQMSDIKMQNFGYLGDKLVCIDYV